MSNLAIALNEPCRVMESFHTSGSVMDGDDHIANVVQVAMFDGRVFWRIFDYVESMKDELEKFFLSQEEADEVTFS